jgi:hypothetical protein
MSDLQQLSHVKYPAVKFGFAHNVPTIYLVNCPFEPLYGCVKSGEERDFSYQ